ncbi:MAG: hypothetical protein HY764_04665 [Candidatus Portnoybacteria bacterium]|nr:hypothetical protein [Candidatus Portnoybacteria bacterium]
MRKIIIIFASVILFGIPAMAAVDYGVTVSDDKLTGFAWSENIGWIKFDGTNYGVTKNATGLLAGYAWSENVGWLSFQDLGGCPSAPSPCEAKIDASGNMTGWAKFLRVTTASGNQGGWVRLAGIAQSGASYGVKISDPANSFAWSNDFGWIRLTLKQADLTADVYQPATPINSGSSISFSGKITNLGNNPVVATKARFCIDNVVDNCVSSKISDEDVSALAAFASSADFSSDPWIAVQGDHKVYLCADATDAVDEFNELNNCDQTATFTVTPSSHTFVIEPLSAVIKKNKTKKFIAKFDGSDVTEDCTWGSDAPYIVQKTTNKGEFRGIGTGSTTVWAKYNDGSNDFEASASVKIVATRWFEFLPW